MAVTSLGLVGQNGGTGTTDIVIPIGQDLIPTLGGALILVICHAIAINTNNNAGATENVSYGDDADLINLCYPPNNYQRTVSPNPPGLGVSGFATGFTTTGASDPNQFRTFRTLSIRVRQPLFAGVNNFHSIWAGSDLPLWQYIWLLAIRETNGMTTVSPGGQSFDSSTLAPTGLCYSKSATSTGSTELALFASAQFGTAGITGLSFIDGTITTEFSATDQGPSTVHANVLCGTKAVSTSTSYNFGSCTNILPAGGVPPARVEQMGGYVEWFQQGAFAPCNITAAGEMFFSEAAAIGASAPPVVTPDSAGGRVAFSITP